jgi:hypothetical protein
MPNKIILIEQMSQQDKRYVKLLNNLKEYKILENNFNLLKIRFFFQFKY